MTRKELIAKWDRIRRKQRFALASLKTPPYDDPYIAMGEFIFDLCDMTPDAKTEEVKQPKGDNT